MAEFVSRDGSILDSRAAVLVNPVNLVGVSGAGLALAFARRYPDNEREYKRACRDGRLAAGKILVTARGPGYGTAPHPYVANVPTKRHWANPSDPELIARGLGELAFFLKSYAAPPVAVPMLGCGLGGLDWRDVRPVVVEKLGAVDGLRVELYERPTRAR